MATPPPQRPSLCCYPDQWELKIHYYIKFIETCFFIIVKLPSMGQTAAVFKVVQIVQVLWLHLAAGKCFCSNTHTAKSAANMPRKGGEHFEMNRRGESKWEILTRVVRSREVANVKIELATSPQVSETKSWLTDWDRPRARSELEGERGWRKKKERGRRREMSNKSWAVSPLPGHSAQRHLCSESNDSRGDLPLTLWSRGGDWGRRGEQVEKWVRKPPDTCPLSRPTPSSLTITLLSFFLPLSLLLLPISQQGDKVRLVGCTRLQANR